MKENNPFNNLNSKNKLNEETISHKLLMENLSNNELNKEIREVKTKDGSITYYNEKYQEYYHSLAGAREEAREKYAIPTINFFLENNLLSNLSNTEKITDNQCIKVLDFCFGLGYNTFIFIEEIRKINKSVPLEIIGIDNDPEIVQISKKLFVKELDEYVYGNDLVKLNVQIGDARHEIKLLKPGFHACFFDPFSPKKTPELWTKEIFAKLYSLMSEKSILITYSCARHVRENLRSAGFKVIDGPIIGRWCPATIGIKSV